MSTKAINVMLACVCLVGAGVVTSRLPARASSDQQQSLEVREALERGGLREAARVAGGHYTRLMDFDPDNDFRTLSFLVKSADAVIATIDEGQLLAQGGLRERCDVEVNLARREMTVGAEKADTRTFGADLDTARIHPRIAEAGPNGNDRPPEAYVLVMGGSPSCAP